MAVHIEAIPLHDLSSQFHNDAGLIHAYPRRDFTMLIHAETRLCVPSHDPSATLRLRSLLIHSITLHAVLFRRSAGHFGTVLI